MKKLSSDDNIPPTDDPSLERLLDLDGLMYVREDKSWVEITAMRVPATKAKPHGVNYSLCLLSPDGERLICFDNAHPVSTGRPPSKKMAKTNDHLHRRGKTEPYAYTDAEQLLIDFWNEIDRYSKDKDIS